MPAPKIDAFWTDPKHNEEKEFLRAVVQREMEEQYRATQERAKKGEKPSTVFDALFGGLFKSGGNEKTFLQSFFDGDK